MANNFDEWYKGGEEGQAGFEERGQVREDPGQRSQHGQQLRQVVQGGEEDQAGFEERGQVREDPGQRSDDRARINLEAEDAEGSDKKSKAPGRRMREEGKKKRKQMVSSPKAVKFDNKKGPEPDGDESPKRVQQHLIRYLTK